MRVCIAVVPLVFMSLVVACDSGSELKRGGLADGSHRDAVVVEAGADLTSPHDVAVAWPEDVPAMIIDGGPDVERGEPTGMDGARGIGGAAETGGASDKGGATMLDAAIGTVDTSARADGDTEAGGTPEAGGTTYVLTVSKAGNGSGTVTSSPTGINCGATCEHAYDDLTTVTLTASASTGSTFAGWAGGDCSGVGTCTILMTAATAVRATFTLKQYTLTVGKAGFGSGVVSSLPDGISCGATCAHAYDYLSSVTLTASPSMGSTFTGWSGGCTGIGGCTVSVASTTLVTATFTPNQYTLTVTKAGAGTGTVASEPAGIDCGSSCSHAYDYNTSVYLTATPSAGWAFKGWSGGGCSGNAGCIVTISAASAVTATFDLLTCDTVSHVFSCNNTLSFAQINFGQLDTTSCLEQCQNTLRSAGSTNGCWVLAGDGNCYCRGGNIQTTTTGTGTGGSCN